MTYEVGTLHRLPLLHAGLPLPDPEVRVGAKRSCPSCRSAPSAPSGSGRRADAGLHQDLSDRGDGLRRARGRRWPWPRRALENGKGQYVPHIYGEKEAGGTSWIYISAVPFADLGFRTQVPLQALPPLTWTYISKIPYVIGRRACVRRGLLVHDTPERRAGEGGAAMKQSDIKTWTPGTVLLVVLMLLGGAAALYRLCCRSRGVDESRRFLPLGPLARRGHVRGASRWLRAASSSPAWCTSFTWRNTGRSSGRRFSRPSSATCSRSSRWFWTSGSPSGSGTPRSCGRSTR